MEARYMTDLEWRICHAVNIYVYKNGRDGEQPILVHIPPAKKKNMKTVLNAIQERVKYPVGYAAHLYKMDGKKIRHPCELEMYNNYVVASNYDKHFKCAQYGRKRSPLLVLNRDSKHVRVLRLQNQNYREWILKKKAVGEERPQYIFPTFYTNENATAKDLPVGQGGHYVPPGALGGACCPNRSDNAGGKTYRVDQQGQSGRYPPQQYGVNTCTIDVTNQKGCEAIRRLEAKPEENKKEDLYCRSKTEVGLRKSDIINANVTTADNTSAAEVATVAESETSLSEGRIRTGTCTEVTEVTSSSEDLDKKYKEMVKKIRKRDKKKEKEVAKNNSNRKSKNNTKAKSKLPVPVNKDDGENNNVDGQQRSVLPPPPRPFRDNKGLRVSEKGDSNGSLKKCSHTSWTSQPSNTTIDIPFIPQDTQALSQQQMNFPHYGLMNPSIVHPGILQSQPMQGMSLNLNPYDVSSILGPNLGEELISTSNQTILNPGQVPILQQQRMEPNEFPMQQGEHQTFAYLNNGYLPFYDSVDNYQQNLENVQTQNPQGFPSNPDTNMYNSQTSSNMSQISSDSSNYSNVADTGTQRPFQEHLGVQQQPQFWVLSGQPGMTGCQQNVGQHGSMVAGYEQNLGVTGNMMTSVFTGYPQNPGVSGYHANAEVTGNQQYSRVNGNEFQQNQSVTGCQQNSEAIKNQQNPDTLKNHPSAPAYQQNPGAKRYQQNPGAKGYQQNPGTTGYQNPGATGYQQNPGATGYQQIPGATGYQQNPGATGYQQNPGATGYQQNPGATGYQQNPGVQRHMGNIHAGNINTQQVLTQGTIHQNPLNSVSFNGVQQTSTRPKKTSQVKKVVQENFEDRSEVEVDIPFTPMVKAGRTYRVQPEKAKFVNKSSNKSEISPATSRNVAIQMGHPSQEDHLTQPLKGPRPQHSQRQQMIPVKIAYATAGGETHLNNGYIFPEETHDLLPSPRRSKISSRDVESYLQQRRLPLTNFQTKTVYKQTSNATTQVNHGFPSLGRSQNSSSSPKNHDNERQDEESRITQSESSNLSLDEYFVSRAQECNSENQMDDLANIPPPTAFREALQLPDRIRDFQNLAGNRSQNTHTDFTSRNDYYYY